VDEEFFYIRIFPVRALKHNKRRKNIMTQCPECEAEVTVRGLMVGEIIYCPDCNAELEVINVEQPEVALAPQVEEDWGE
jgi:alpha-aminoadipate carrier protein LysW